MVSSFQWEVQHLTPPPSDDSLQMVLIFGLENGRQEKTLKSSLAKVRKTLVDKTPTPHEALNYFCGMPNCCDHGTAVYTGFFFASLDEPKRTRRAEIDNIINDTYDEIKETVTEGGLDLRTGEKVSEILRCRGFEIEELGKHVDVHSFNLSSTKILKPKTQWKGLMMDSSI